jgi:hypothetical protein
VEASASEGDGADAKCVADALSIANTPAVPIKPRRALEWAVVTSCVVLLLLVGLRSWNIMRTDAVGRFWSPVLDQKTPTVISLGGVVFSPRSNIGTEVATDPANLNPYLSFENGLAMGRVAALINARGGVYRVQPSSYITRR